MFRIFADHINFTSSLLLSLTLLIIIYLFIKMLIIFIVLTDGG